MAGARLPSCLTAELFVARGRPRLPPRPARGHPLPSQDSRMEERPLESFVVGLELLTNITQNLGGALHGRAPRRPPWGVPSGSRCTSRLAAGTACVACNTPAASALKCPHTWSPARRPTPAAARGALLAANLRAPEPCSPAARPPGRRPPRPCCPRRPPVLRPKRG